MTENLKHFDASEADEAGFEVVHHDDFGLVLADLNLAAIVRHIQRAPLDRYERYLVNLEREIPKTVERLQAVLEGDEPRLF